MSPRNWRAPAAAVALLLASAWVPQALAQTPLPATPAEDPLSVRDAKRVDRMEKVMRELRAIVFQLRDTGKPVVVQPADTDARMQELSNRIGDLEQTLTRINGQMESTAYSLEQARKANADLSAQVKALSDQLAAQQQAQMGAQTAANPPPAVEPPPGPDAPPLPTAAEAFANARQLMLAGDYDGAEAAFAAFVETYPESTRTSEARYWWGKTLTARGAYAPAASAYIAAIRAWPKASWAPDAVVELARSLVALKKPQDACATLAELPKRYPKASDAVAARAAATAKQAKCAA
jgi:tol-pal system protein YbgF